MSKGLIKLSAKNFTTLARTPWAGEVLSRTVKKNHTDAGSKIGESWEVSCNIEKPSQCEDLQCTLTELFEKKGLDLFGTDSCELLVKLIDTSANLSIQLHPDDDYPKLKEDESGKPECWYILDHQPGAGVYIGFKKNVSIKDIEDTIRDESKRSHIVEHMNFVEVRKGDFFDIQPGTLHAIGKGVTLLECQKSVADKKLPTYRLWDWDRKYSKDGTLDNENGKSRPLHINECLDIMNISEQSGQTFLKKCRPQPVYQPDYKMVSFPKNQYCQLHIMQLDPQDESQVQLENGYLIIIPIDQKLDLECGGESHSLELGHSYLTTKDLQSLRFTSHKKTKVAIICPEGTQLHNL